ncbi:poly(A) polymerase type 3-like [Boleophthalmus pectinirostris]|uniref:poly(A) polymerase type 3-like n=1 Tax=Boleophthalmus pectinirostris TaxID=150288 RepID=UPI00242DFD94|nr:poly(A) polymerase type 3-like [Boleophthalmus pectinirostris]
MQSKPNVEVVKHVQTNACMLRFLEITSLSDIPKWYGVTEPISFDFPSQEEIPQTLKLTETLKAADLFESHLQIEHREMVVRHLESLFKRWLTETCLDMNVPEVVTEKVGGRVLPFGSFALGLNIKNSDIDLLCLGPGFVPRQAFFSSFVEKLQAEKAIQIVQVIEDAFVPVIKLLVAGIEVDMVYAKIYRKSISDKMNLMDPTHLQGMDIHSVRSLQGYRVTQEILSLVPNVFTFRLVLTVIKHWAQCRNIYSNKMGFLGGVSWAILVARICQLYPYATAAVVVAKFFKVYSIWEWPIPILLRNPEEQKLNFPVWNPKDNVRDRLHQMPIITPSYPHQNSSYNVTASTRNIMMEEFKRGHNIMQEGFEKKTTWKNLFQQAVFFQDYKHYIALRATAPTEAKHKEWTGYVESKIRHLVGILEKNPNILVACPSLQTFPEKNGLGTTWVIGIKLSPGTTRSFSLNPDVLSFVQSVYANAESFRTEDMQLEAEYENKETYKHVIAAFVERQEESAVVAPERRSAPKRPHTPDSEPEAKRRKTELISGRTRHSI